MRYHETPTLEDGWSEMADGLHVQRWFLNARPAREARIAALARSLLPDVPGIDELRAVLPDDLIEHVLHPCQPANSFRVVDTLRYSEFASGLGGADVLLVPASACVPGATPLVQLCKLPSGAIARSPTFSDMVSAVLEVACVDYFFRINTRVVVETPGPSMASDAVDRGHLLGTVEVPTDAPPYTYAEHLAARSAARFGYSFLLARPDNTAPSAHGWSSPWSSSEAMDTLSLYSEVLAKSVRLRMRERVSTRAPELMTTAERADCMRSTGFLRQQLLTLEALVNDIERVLALPGGPNPPDNNMDVGDLLCTLFPGQTQFHKYRQGGGAGQAE